MRTLIRILVGIILFSGGSAYCARVASGGIVFNRVEFGPATPQVRGSIYRVVVAVRNISSYPQTVTVRLRGIAQLNAVKFLSSPPAAPSQLSNWTTDPFNPLLVTRSFSLPDQTAPVLNISANATSSASFSIACPFNNASSGAACVYSNEFAVVGATPLTAVENAAMQTFGGVDITVNENVGAVVADYTIQNLISAPINREYQITRAVLNGHPF